MKIYRANNINILINIALATISILVVALIKGSTSRIIGITICLVILVYFLSLIFEKRPIRIQISDSNLGIISTRFLIPKKETILDIQNLTQSYKKEIGPRGIKIKVYRLYNHSKSTVIKIVPGYHGWNEKTIKEMIVDFQKLGIREIE